MNACAACGLRSLNRLCHFCRRTVELVKAERCVSCTGPIDPLASIRVESQCGACRSRFVSMSRGTRHLLKLAAQTRYRRAA